MADKIEWGAGTPGPWHTEDPLGCDAGDHLWIVQEGASSEVYDWRNLAVVCSDDPREMDCIRSKPITVAERDANARAIAEVPAMVEAMRRWVSRFEHAGLYDDRDHCAAILARIDKES